MTSNLNKSAGWDIWYLVFAQAIYNLSRGFSLLETIALIGERLYLIVIGGPTDTSNGRSGQ